MNLLEKIQGPQDLKKLSEKEIKDLAEEIRQYIVQVVSKTGGHLAPNLGVVELTLALHLVYEAPQDKIIWDVGHQSYTHKILTGRLKELNTLRQFDGIAGFPKRSESPYDVFDTGHSSTSISAALGFALARDIKKENYNVVAVIGDGAMTGGMAFEALNHAGHLGSKLTVVLNDNRMSIAKNVGAMAAYLNRVRVDPLYTKRKEDIEYILKKVPAIGPKVIKVADRIKDSLRYLLVPGMLFEEMGFKYFGPVDGHNCTELRTVLNNTKKINRPVLVHVITQKGKGYLPAQRHPDKFHGTGAFNIKTGLSLKKNSTVSYTEVFSDTLIKLGKEHKNLLAITAAMGSGTGTAKFAEKFPDRYFDVGIAEQHAVTMAAALALEGYKPVVAIYSTFLQRAYDQILHDVALQKAPVCLVLDRAGLVGEDGPTHHGVFDFAYLRHIPNMVVMAPKDENELQHMLNTAIKYNGPIALRFPRGNGLGVKIEEDIREIPIGKAELLQEGSDLTLLAIGNMVKTAQEVAERLSKEKSSKSTVINARFVKPLDKDLILEACKKTKGLVTLEENCLEGGFGSAVLELLQENNIMLPTLRIGLADEFIVHGNTDVLREHYGLTPQKIVEKIYKKFDFINSPLKKIVLNFSRR